MYKRGIDIEKTINRVIFEIIVVKIKSLLTGNKKKFSKVKRQL